MKCIVLRTFSTTWFAASVLAFLSACEFHLFLNGLFMIVQMIIAWQFCNATWQDDCNKLGK